MNSSAFSELATLYFECPEEERRTIRREFLIHADKKTARSWATAEKTEVPELHYLVRDEFILFFAKRQNINV